MNSRIKKLTAVAMLSAVAYLVMAIGRIPVVSFLKYDPKDVIIAIGGFIYGPLSAFGISVIVSLVEMVTLSDTGWIGLIMNILSTVSFVCIASFFYKKSKTLKGAIIGLIAGSVAMVTVMILWNYLITPIYMGIPREAVAKMLLPVFLPFNLLKASLNTAFTLIIYKPLVTGLRKTGLLPPSDSKKKKHNIGLIIISLLIIITCILIILVMNNKI